MQALQLFLFCIVSSSSAFIGLIFIMASFIFQAANLIVLLTISSFARAIHFTPTGSTVELNGVPYYVPAMSVGTLTIAKDLAKAVVSSGGLFPLTVIKTNSSTYGSADLSSTVDSFSASDDVFNQGFLECK
jgi:hypothetical protein